MNFSLLYSKLSTVVLLFYCLAVKQSLGKVLSGVLLVIGHELEIKMEFTVKRSSTHTRTENGRLRCLQNEGK